MVKHYYEDDKDSIDEFEGSSSRRYPRSSRTFYDEVNVHDSPRLRADERDFNRAIREGLQKIQQ